MSDKALELQVKTQNAVTEYFSNLPKRLRDDERGVVTTEWLMLMVAIVALAGALTATGVWTNVAKAIAETFEKLIKSFAP